MEVKNEEFSIEMFVELYDKMEEITAKSIDLNIKQLEGRISQQDAKRELYNLSDVYCDVSQKLFNISKKIRADIKARETDNQKENQ